MGEKAPLDDRRETHGICVTHRVAVQARWNDIVGEAARRGQPLASFKTDGDPSGSDAEHQLTILPSYLWVGIRNLTRKVGF